MGASTFLKKLSILAFGFPGVLACTAFLLEVWDFPCTDRFDFEFGRGVWGLAGRLAIVEGGRGDRVSFGGVGALPVEGFKGVSIEAFSRGLRNIVWSML